LTFTPPVKLGKIRSALVRSGVIDYFCGLLQILLAETKGLKFDAQEMRRKEVNGFNSERKIKL
jgi:hypothetical protein